MDKCILSVFLKSERHEKSFAPNISARMHGTGDGGRGVEDIPGPCDIHVQDGDLDGLLA
jgi:hypothetical protein